MRKKWWLMALFGAALGVGGCGGSGAVRMPASLADLGSVEGVSPADLSTGPRVDGGAPDLARPRDPGLTDDPCDPKGPQQQACYTGPKGTADVGACRSGTQRCDVTGYWTTCANEALPSTDICDGLDNDCDGVADNGCPVPDSPLAPLTGSSQVWGALADPQPLPCKGNAVYGLAASQGQGSEFPLTKPSLACATMKIAEDKSTIPWTYSLATVTSQTLNTTGTNWAEVCPKGVVTGLIAYLGNGGVADIEAIGCSVPVFTGKQGAWSVSMQEVSPYLPSSGFCHFHTCSTYICPRNGFVTSVSVSTSLFGGLVSGVTGLEVYCSSGSQVAASGNGG